MNELVKIENGKIEIAKETVRKIVDFEKKSLEVELMKKELKKELKAAMEKNGITKFSVEGLSAVIREGSTRTTLDSKRLKEELPDIYEEYSKISNVASSLVLTIND